MAYLSSVRYVLGGLYNGSWTCKKCQTTKENAFLKISKFITSIVQNINQNDVQQGQQEFCIGWFFCLHLQEILLGIIFIISHQKMH